MYSRAQSSWSSSTDQRPAVRSTRRSCPVQPPCPLPVISGLLSPIDERVHSAALAAKYFSCTLSPHPSNHSPLPSSSTNSIAAVGQAVAQAGSPPHRLHFDALSLAGSVKTVPNGQAIVHK